MYKVCSLRLGPNFRVCSAADKKFYLRLTVEKMCGFAVFTDKYSSPCGCSGTNFTVLVYYKNSKSEMKSEIIKIQIYFVMKQIFLLCQQQTCLFVVNRLSYELPTAPTILTKKHI